MSQSSRKLMPNLDQEGTKHINLTVLQRIDPSIQDIILTVSHVALYEFNVTSSQWSRKDVQGSLFVVRRNKDPWYQFIVMNQRNTDNHVENLSGNFEFDVQVPYLLYKNVDQEVNGLWFYNSPECEVVADLFNRLIESCARISSEPLLNKSDFKEHEPVPSVAEMERLLEPLSVSKMERLSEASHVSSSASTNAAGATGATEISSISNFFNAATNTYDSGKPVQSFHPSSEHLSSLGSSSLIPAPAGHLHVSSVTASAPAVHLIPQHDVTDSAYRSSQITNLVTPAIFHSPHSSSSAVPLPPVSSSMPFNTLQSSLALQRPYGAPFLQPYPPPAPSPFLTPQSATASSPFLTPQSATAPTHGPVIDRGKVHEALLTLVQDNQFIDMVWKALQRVHQG